MRARSGTAIFGMTLLAVSFLFMGCRRGVDVVPGGEAQLIRYSHSDTCVGSLTLDTAEVGITVRGLRITVIHKDAILNCCLDSIMVEFIQEGSLLKLTETDVASNPCYCVCPFEVRATVEVSCPGTYTIEIWTGSSLVWTGEVEVEGG